MRVHEKIPAREFTVGHAHPFTLRDCGNVALDADEQVTFVTEAGGEYDVARKEWGFYATPSTNARLPSFGLRTALVRNQEGRCYIMLVEHGRDAAFRRYLAAESNRVVAWLDNNDVLARIEAVCEGTPR